MKYLEHLILQYSTPPLSLLTTSCPNTPILSRIRGLSMMYILKVSLRGRMVRLVGEGPQSRMLLITVGYILFFSVN